MSGRPGDTLADLQLAGQATSHKHSFPIAQGIEGAPCLSSIIPGVQPVQQLSPKHGGHAAAGINSHIDASCVVAGMCICTAIAQADAVVVGRGAGHHLLLHAAVMVGGRAA